MKPILTTVALTFFCMNCQSDDGDQFGRDVYFAYEPDEYMRAPAEGTAQNKPGPN
jgi:hypothetical protein